MNVRELIGEHRIQKWYHNRHLSPKLRRSHVPDGVYDHKLTRFVVIDGWDMWMMSKMWVEKGGHNSGLPDQITKPEFNSFPDFPAVDK